WELGRLDQARAEFEAVLATRTEQFGADHPSTLVARHNLALVLRELGLEEEKDN
ncbi:tetratricopeptide repeat protein, partial [Saccharomonospora viridis]